MRRESLIGFVTPSFNSVSVIRLPYFRIVYDNCCFTVDFKKYGNYEEILFRSKSNTSITDGNYKASLFVIIFESINLQNRDLLASQSYIGRSCLFLLLKNNPEPRKVEF